jgi:hypothetical protein
VFGCDLNAPRKQHQQRVRRRAAEARGIHLCSPIAATANSRNWPSCVDQRTDLSVRSGSYCGRSATKGGCRLHSRRPTPVLQRSGTTHRSPTAVGIQRRKADVADVSMCRPRQMVRRYGVVPEQWHRRWRLRQARVFVFIGRRRDRAKLLVWDRHGFWVLYCAYLLQRRTVYRQYAHTPPPCTSSPAQRG